MIHQCLRGRAIVSVEQTLASRLKLHEVRDNFAEVKEGIMIFKRDFYGTLITFSLHSYVLILIFM
jgi:hypothetical protein